MLRIEAGDTKRYCDGISRRSFVQVGVAGMAAVGLPQILRAKQASVEMGHAKKDTAVLLIWLDGGPSHLDTYDMKPDAPDEIRGFWRPIRTNVPGIEISEMFPRQAALADKFSIVRSLHHDRSGHFEGAHLMLTGRLGSTGGDTTPRYPSIGSIASRVCGARKAGLPPYVSVPWAKTVGLKPGYFGATYLGIQHNPFQTEGDPNKPDFQVQNTALAGGMTIDRLEDRQGLLRHFDHIRRDADTSHAMDAMDRFEREAYELVVGPAARKAFDLASESPQTRERYGRNRWGQSTLLARRLVEAGSTFVTVDFGGWDHHWNMQRDMGEIQPRLDTAVSALFQDLFDRGLQQKVLVVMCGEFGRTPRLTDLNMPYRGTPGRGHWGNAMFCVLGGGGVQGGRVYGSTNRLGEMPHDKPVEPCDIHATIYHVLGVDPSVGFLNTASRPIPILDRGQVIHELL